MKLTDFGIAKAADAAPVTRSGMVMGTAHYIAPEQALGHEAEPASDVYSLAVVGYECLAGHRPFLSENAVTVAMMHIHDRPPPLPLDVPPPARAVIEATLVKDPRQRYGSGAEFAAAVAAVRAGHPLPAPVGRPLAPLHHGGGPPTDRAPQIQPHFGLSTGSFPPGPPLPPTRSRTALWVLIVVLVIALITLTVLGLPALLSSGDPGEREDPRTTANGRPMGSNVQPGEPLGPSELPRGAGKPGPLVEVNRDKYLGRPATLAIKELAAAGITTQVLTHAGTTPREVDTCIVTDVVPVGARPVGSQVTIRCQQGGPPG